MKVRLKLVLIMTIAVMLITAISFKVNASENEQDNTNIETVDETIKYIQELERLALEFGASDIKSTNITVLTYLRQDRYNSKEWQMLAGEINTEFNSYVDNNKKLDISKLKSINNLDTCNGYSVDFIHMLASINMILKGYGILGSWGGDVLELAYYYKDGYTKEDLKESLLNQYGNFGINDVNSDIDAINIGYISKSLEMRISDALRLYYITSKSEDRYNDFIRNMVKDYDLEAIANYTDTYEEAVKIRMRRRFNDDICILYLRQNMGIDNEVYDTLINDCIDTFTEHILENADGQAYNWEEIITNKNNEETELIKATTPQKESKSYRFDINTWLLKLYNKLKDIAFSE